MSERESACRCPYCTGDADALAEMAGNYELDLHRMRQHRDEALAHLRHLLTCCGRCGGHGVVRESFMETIATEYGGMLMRTKGPESPCPDCAAARQFVEPA